MESTTNKSGVHYRTRLLTEPRARSFAAALAANPAFTLMDVETSPRAKGEARFFVTFRPANAARQQDLQRRQQDTRQARAEAQGSEYLWCPDRGFLWCLSTSGEVYEVTPGRSCTCGDFVYRCQGAGLQCKHLLSIDAGLGTMLPAFETVPARRAA